MEDGYATTAVPDARITDDKVAMAMQRAYARNIGQGAGLVGGYHDPRFTRAAALEAAIRVVGHMQSAESVLKAANLFEGYLNGSHVAQPDAPDEL